MNERYSRLYSLPERLYFEGAPVLIAAGALLRDNQTGHMLAQLKFESLSVKPIRALKVALRAFDVTGTELSGLSEYQYLDLNVQRGSEFGQKVAVPLPDDVTRSFSCVCSSVVFSDGSIWTAPADAVWEPLKQQTTLDGCLGSELAAQYRRETFSGAVYAVTEDRDLWMCTCGAVNRCSETYCFKCRTCRGGLLSAMDVDKLREHAKEYAERKAQKAAEEKVREEKKAAERQVRRAKRKKTLLISGLATAVLIIALIILTKTVIPNVRYNAAVNWLHQEKFDKAIEAFETLRNYKNSAEMVTEASYQKGIWLLENGNYDEAITAFTSIYNYKDSNEMVTEATYQKGLHLLENGERKEGLRILEDMRDYKDAEEAIENCYVARYGDFYTTVKNAKVGSTITFGSYEQDGNDSNGKEPIEWIIYEKSSDGREASLVSKYVLDCVYASTGTYDNWDWVDMDLPQIISDRLVRNLTQEERGYLRGEGRASSSKGQYIYFFAHIPGEYEIEKYNAIGRIGFPTADVQSKVDVEDDKCKWLYITSRDYDKTCLGFVDSSGSLVDYTNFARYFGIRFAIQITFPDLRNND